eukprot:scaffold2425_cov76-Skeletonema_dohrnii-CCMP3373.AAC.18
MKFLATLLTALLCTEVASALSVVPAKQPAAQTISRRDAAASIFSIGVTAAAFFTPTQNANAAEDNQVLSDEEMAARIARKMELLNKSKSGGGGGGGGGLGGGGTTPVTDIRSDVNPEAAVNLRSRSAVENAKIAMDKQKEMKSRDNAKKREDLCEMLGRGC